MYHPRWLNRIYASLNNYFWIPCPICGRFFGGHECTGELHYEKARPGGANGAMTCPKCPGDWNEAKQSISREAVNALHAKQYNE